MMMVMVMMMMMMMMMMMLVYLRVYIGSSPVLEPHTMGWGGGGGMLTFM